MKDRSRLAQLGGAILWLAVAVGPPVHASSPAQNTAAPVTFSRDIAPIVFSHCGECHHPGGPAPFSLITYDAARQHARQMVAATGSGLMPPWKSETGYGEFIGQPHLTREQTRLIERWVEDGVREGDRRDLPPRPSWPDGWRLGSPDLVVRLPETYMLPAGGTDVFRIFVLRVPVDAPRFVRGIEFRPGNARVVHHANIRIDRTPNSRDLDEGDPAPGYDGLMARTALFPPGHFLGWTPGQVAPLVARGLAWRLDPGTDLVIQLHMQPGGKPEAVQPSVGFFFGPDPPDRTVAMIRLGRQDIDIPAGERRYTVSDSYLLPADVEVQAVQPHAHYRARLVEGFATLPDGTREWLIYIKDWDFRWQHLYRYRAPFRLPAGTTIEMRYTYDNSAANARNPERPPVRALWGQRSSEEMGDLWIQVTTRSVDDLARLNRDYRPKAVREHLVGYESLILRDPDNAGLHDDAAMLCLELGSNGRAVTHFEASARLAPRSATARFNLGTVLALDGRVDDAIAQFERAIAIEPEYANAHNSLGNALNAARRLADAVVEYQEAVRIDPDHVAAHNNLGSALLQLGRVSEATAEFQRALTLNPNYVNAHANLATTLASAGRVDEAAVHFRDALRIDPGHAQAHNNLGRLMLETGRIDEAVAHFREALRSDPGYVEAHYNLGSARRSQGDLVEAVAELGRAVDRGPLWLPALVDLAWVLATTSDERLRDPDRAVGLAERARAIAGAGDAATLDVLGVAYAAAGRFDDATATARAALDVKPPEPLASDIRDRLALYAAGRPYRTATPAVPALPR